jgi:hypothetical protein
MLVKLLQQLHAKDNPPAPEGAGAAARRGFALLPGTRVPPIPRRAPPPRRAPSRKAGEQAGWE